MSGEENTQFLLSEPDLKVNFPRILRLPANVETGREALNDPRQILDAGCGKAFDNPARHQA
jgi:hypothetical protein